MKQDKKKYYYTYILMMIASMWCSYVYYKENVTCIDIKHFGYASFGINLVATILIIINIYRAVEYDRDSLISKSSLLIVFNLITVNQIVLQKIKLHDRQIPNIELDAVMAIIGMLFIGLAVNIFANNIVNRDL